MNNSNQQKTHFGYQEVPEQDKVNLVAEVFRSVAPKYDLMNDLMSLGMHRLWKQIALTEANLKPGQTVLDMASGTGDLAKAIAKAVTRSGKVFMSDINDAMLTVGRERMEDAGLIGNIHYIQADAEQLPFADNYFDCVTIAFGLRNVTRKGNALAAFYRVLKPGGRLLILEFSKPSNSILDKIYNFYSFNVIPKLGDIVTNDRASYQYLVESIRMHPDQNTLKAMMETAGFEDVTFDNLTNGIVALHMGYKY